MIPRMIYGKYFSSSGDNYGADNVRVLLGTTPYLAKSVTNFASERINR